MTISESILAKIKRYCDYQERAHQDVRNKLLQWKVYGQDLEDTLVRLIQEDLLNEERFATSYVRGKFRIKHWGREKIIQGLNAKHISAFCIRKGLAEIDEQEYVDIAAVEAKKYWDSKQSQFDEAQLSKKTYQHLRRKGFEHEVAFQSVSMTRQN